MTNDLIDERGALTDSSGMRWTGHPLVDAGVATLVGLAGRIGPGEVTQDDLYDAARYLAKALDTAAIRSHASVLFTINTPYLQPSFTPERRKEKARQILSAFSRAPADDAEVCIYCGRSAAHVETATGRAYREYIPLLTGQGVANFAPYGRHGAAVCGLCILALQALTIGAPSCEGRALIVAADDPDQLVALIRSDDWLGAVMRRVQLSEATGQKVETWKSPRTRLIDALIGLERAHQLPERTGGFTAFHVSNSGQGPGIDIYPASAAVVGFVRRAQGALFHSAWRQVERRQWLDAKRRNAETEPDAENRHYWRNRLYEDLFGLPESAPLVIRRHLLGPELAQLKRGPNADHVALWPIAELLLEEVLKVDIDRAEQIKALADGLADEIATQGDTPLFRRVFRLQRYPTVRNLLIGASSKRIRRGAPPLLTFEGFLDVFEIGEDLPRADWRLAWDLVLIRLIDQLYQANYFGRNPEAAAEIEGAMQPDEPEEAEVLAPSAQ